MRVLHAFPFYSVRFAGGTPDFMFKIAKAQAKSGLSPIIYAGSHELDPSLVKRLPNVPVRVVRSYLDRQGFSLMPGLRKQLSDDLPHVDVVHMHVFRTYQNLILFEEATRRNIPVVVDAHGSVPYAKRKRILKRLFDLLWGRRMLREADKLLAETEVGVAEYLSVVPDLPHSQIQVISPPFDTDEFEDLPEPGAFRKELGLPSDAKIVLFLGRIHWIKGNDFLIKGFARLRKREPAAWLVLVGSDDGHMSECKQLAKELGVEDRVLFAGFADGRRKLSALVDANVVAQMSRQEQGAWAPFEAVLVGTPIVVTEHTGSGEDVKRLDAGDTVTFDDEEMLADKLTEILDNQDSARARAKRAGAFIRNRLSMNARVHEYTTIYEEAIRKSKQKLSN